MQQEKDSVNPQVKSGFIWRVSLIAGLGGILYGYDMGIIAAALIFVRSAFNLSTQMQEIVVSVVLVGAMLGAIYGGAIADRIGRRNTLLWGGAIFILGSILAPLSPNVGTLIVARMLLGVAIGFTSVTAPVYVSELSPPQSRGRLIGLYQLALTVGIALSDLVGYWLAGQQAWRMMFGIGAIPAVIFLLMILTLPESPRWLFSKNRAAEAMRVLQSYTDEAGAQLLLDDIRGGLAAQVETRWSALWSPSVRRSLIIAVGFTILYPITGINTIIYYGPQIFTMAGITSNSNAIFATLLVAITNVLATVIALALVDRIGRKPLLYAGVGGMTASLFTLAAAFHFQTALAGSLGILATVCLMVYITCFAASIGTIAWILVAEVFPLRLRGRGAAAATLGAGISNFIVSLTFLSLLNTAGNALTFSIYGGCCILTLLFTWFIIPETKGRELESISAATSTAV
ncbi:MAG: sugar porter family MFS transporter [Terracidiphilus sp.]